MSFNLNNLATQLTATGVKAGLAALTGAIAIEELYNSGPSAPVTVNKSLMFPSDLVPPGNFRNYSLQMQFSQYSKKSQQKSKVLPVQGQNGIFLPIPNQLKDDKTVTYDTPELGVAMGMAVNAALNKGITGSALKDSLTGLAEGAGQKVLGGTGYAAASAVTGAAFNPFQTFLFKTPNFRTHTFSWKLVPKTLAESNKIKEIINLLYTNMLPDIDGAAAIFKYPSIVNVQLNPVTDYLYKFKPCVLTSVSANYAPQSTPAFYRGSNAPAVVDLSIELREIELWTRLDYPSQGTSLLSITSTYTSDNGTGNSVQPPSQTATALGNAATNTNSGLGAEGPAPLSLDQVKAAGSAVAGFFQDVGTAVTNAVKNPTAPLDPKTAEAVGAAPAFQ